MENKAVRFALTRISTDQFAIIEKVFCKDVPVELKLGLQFGADTFNKTISVKIMVQFEQKNTPFIITEASCYFNIEPDAWQTLINDHEIMIPMGMITHLTVLTIGTVRGILHAKTEGTNFNGFVLPTVNVTELIKEDVHIEFPQQ